MGEGSWTSQPLDVRAAIGAESGVAGKAVWTSGVDRWMMGEVASSLGFGGALLMSDGSDEARLLLSSLLSLLSSSNVSGAANSSSSRSTSLRCLSTLGRRSVERLQQRCGLLCMNAMMCCTPLPR